MEQNGSQTKDKDKRTILDKIVKYFDGSISVWSLKYGTSFFYNNNVSKGEIIDIMFKKMSNMEERLTLTFDDQLQNVAKIVRQIILNMEPTYTRWPSNDEELIENKSSIPSCLQTLIASIVSADK